MKVKSKFRRPYINGRLVILLSAFIILILMLASPIRDLVAQRARIAALALQVQQSEKQVELLREIQAKWNDPNFVAAQARARLHYVMPGEIVFSVIGLDGQPEIITNAPAATAWAGEPLPPQPWYKNLYDSWLEADSGEELLDESETTAIRPNAPK
ncbi:MAG: septum formation initiator family protein [Actinomycetota bacterium]|nr:septum formation initiator family protein [Actinomycetota bacterium]